jgi:integrase
VRHSKPLLNRAGLPDIRCHDLRHTCATLLLTKGVHPKIVSESVLASLSAWTMEGVRFATLSDPVAHAIIRTCSAAPPASASPALPQAGALHLCPSKP